MMLAYIVGFLTPVFLLAALWWLMGCFVRWTEAEWKERHGNPV